MSDRTSSLMSGEAAAGLGPGTGVGLGAGVGARTEP